MGKLEKKLKPIEKKLRDAIAERDAAISDRAQAEEEKEMWHCRVNHMVSKYHQIDPAIHQEKMQKLEGTEKELDSLNKAYAKMRQTLMPKLKDKAQTEKKRADAATKDLEAAKEKIQELEANVSSLEKSYERLRKTANVLKARIAKKGTGAPAATSGGRVTPVPSTSTSTTTSTKAASNKGKNNKNKNKDLKGGKKGKKDESNKVEEMNAEEKNNVGEEEEEEEEEVVPEKKDNNQGNKKQIQKQKKQQELPKRERVHRQRQVEEELHLYLVRQLPLLLQPKQLATKAKITRIKIRT